MGGVPLGTAFLVGIPAAESSDFSYYALATARHVVASQRLVSARFSVITGEKKTIALDYDLEVKRKEGDYWESSDASVDLALFFVGVPEGASFKIVPQTLIAARDDFAKQDIQETDRIIFPSLLVGLQGLSRDFPVVRDGSISLIPTEPIPWGAGKSELILINAAANQGSSGAPVFLWPGPRLQHGAFTVGGTQPLLLGVVTGFFNSIPREITAIDKTNGRTVPLDMRTADGHPAAIAFQEDSRVGVITPSWKLRELTSDSRVRSRIDALIRANSGQGLEEIGRGTDRWRVIWSMPEKLPQCLRVARAQLPSSA